MSLICEMKYKVDCRSISQWMIAMSARIFCKPISIHNGHEKVLVVTRFMLSCHISLNKLSLMVERPSDLALRQDVVLWRIGVVDSDRSIAAD